MARIRDILFHIQWYWENHPKSFGVIIGIITFLLTAILSGIIENIAAGWFTAVFIPWVRARNDVSHFTIGLMVISAFVTGGILSVLLCRCQSERESFDKLLVANVLSVAADHYRRSSYLDILREIDNLFRASWGSTAHPDPLSDFIDKFYITIFRYLGIDDIGGGGVLLPCSEDKEWLCFWYAAPDTVLSSKRFYIGTSDNERNKFPRGVAGKVFIEDRPRIVKIIDRAKGKTDDPDFHFFEVEHRRAAIPYASFVALPIHWQREVIGVLTIESSKTDTFVSSDLPFLQDLANKVGDAIVFHGKIDL